MTSLAARWRTRSRDISLSSLAPILIPAGLLLGLAYLAYDGIGIRPLMLLAVAGGALALLLRPEWGPVVLVLAALAVPLQFGTGTEVTLNAATLLVPALGALWLAHGLLRRRLTWTASPADRPWLLFLAAGLLSLGIGRATWDPAVPVQADFILVQLAQWAIFAFAALAYWLPGMLLRGPRDAERMTWALLWVGGGPPIAVVPNGVDCEHHRPGLALPRPGSLVYNGAMTYSANYDAMQFFLRDVYPLVRAQAPDVSLTITGSTSGVDLAGLALDDSVRLSGYVDDIRPVIAGSAACVVPLRQGGGTRLKILEAMALGVPVVSTRKGAEGLDVVDGEHLLLADGPRALAVATVRPLQDGALRARLATNACAPVEQRYDWRAIGAAFTDLVEDAVQSQRGAES